MPAWKHCGVCLHAMETPISEQLVGKNILFQFVANERYEHNKYIETTITRKKQNEINR